MGDRYNNKTIFRNDHESYEAIFEERHVPYIRQYGTSTMMTPSVAQIMNFSTVPYIWAVGDRFYKLAIQFYSDPQYWWVIALYNKKPTEASINIGDVITIPLPLENVLRSMRS